MAGFKPSFPYSTAFMLLKPVYENVLGVESKTFVDSGLLNTSFKTYGGTEREVNGVYSIEDTAVVETWYRPDITSDCSLRRMEDGAVFEILNQPEDINFRHQFLKMKVRRVKGGA